MDKVKTNRNNMIKAQDLRLLNWVYFAGGDYPHYAQATDFEMLEYFSRNGNPIPLTPELLESAGFERNDYIYRKHAICGATFFIEQTGDSFRSVMDANYPEFVDCSEPFKYLHQLQNLYYFSVFEELEIKAMSPSASQTL